MIHSIFRFKYSFDSLHMQFGHRLILIDYFS